VMFTKPPYKNFRPKLVKLDLTTLNSDKNSRSHQLLLDAILDYTREYRRYFDSDPRFQSTENLRMLRNALNSCVQVPGLTEANNGELGFFEEHIYRNYRDQFPKKSAVA